MLTRSRSRLRKQTYRARVRSSKCRGQTKHCTRSRGCKRTRRGIRRSYCRKSRNSHI